MANNDYVLVYILIQSLISYLGTRGPLSPDAKYSSPKTDLHS